MLHPETAAESLRIRRVFPARQERVFKAWTSPAALRQWWSPPGLETPVAEVELRVGGRYRLGMRPKQGGDLFYLSGTFEEVSPHAKLVYTWAWENDAEMGGETLVTVEFHPRGDSTEVVLTHERFQTPEQVAMHQHGWQGCLEGMEAYLTAEESSTAR